MPPSDNQPAPLAPSSRRQAFTLTEMLVVVGIVILLAGLLLPAVANARRASRLAACASNLREVGIAFSEYLTANDGAFPDAAMSNSYNSPYSPRGLSEWKKRYGYTPFQPITVDDGPIPPSHFDPRWNGVCLPAVGYYFAKRFTSAPLVWRCPAQGKASAAGGGATGFSQSMNATTEEDPDRISSYTGNKAADGWTPGYMYLATKEYEFTLNTDPNLANYLRVRDMMVRNISGLTLHTAKPVGGGGSDTIVTFTDMSVGHHSRSKTDVRTLEPGATGRFTSNFLFLDGHVDARPFTTYPDYLAQFHRPIRQRQNGRDYAASFSTEMGPR